MAAPVDVGETGVEGRTIWGVVPAGVWVATSGAVGAAGVDVDFGESKVRDGLLTAMLEVVGATDGEPVGATVRRGSDSERTLADC